MLRRLPRIPIAALLVFGLSGLVLVAVASVLALAIGAARDNTVDLARDKAELVISMADERLRQTLDRAPEQITRIAEILVRDRIDPLQDRAFVDLARGALSAGPQISGMAFFTPDAEVVRVVRTPAGFVRRQAKEDVPLVRAALDEAARRQGPYWGEIAWNSGNSQPLINLRMPVREGDRFIGLLVTGIGVSDLSAILARVAEDTNATAFVLVGRDRVLAHPRLTRLFSQRSAEEPLPALEAVGDDRLTHMWDRADRFEAARSRTILGQEGHIVRDGDETWVYLYRQIDRYGPQPWLIGTYMNETTIGAALDRMYHAIGAGIAILVLAVSTAMYLGRWLTGRLKAFAAAADSVRSLDFANAERLPPSRVREIDDAGRAFNAMLDGLQAFETYVPKALLRRLVRLGGQKRVRSLQREVTVMFTDISGFTSLSEAMTAPEVAAFLNMHFALVDGCIDDSGGTVDKHMGDGVMAFWGAPDEQPDHALRACHAAQAIARVIAADNARRRGNGQPPVRLRVGIHSGPVTVGNIGAASRLNYTIVGDTVNTAQRLCDLAREIDWHGMEVAILVSGATVRRARLEERAQPVGLQVLRGRAEPVPVFRLVDAENAARAAE